MLPHAKCKPRVRSTDPEVWSTVPFVARRQERMVPICTAGIIHPPRVDSEPCNRKGLETCQAILFDVLFKIQTLAFGFERTAAIACYFATLSAHPHR
jgi:hypothetical protein